MNMLFKGKTVDKTRISICLGVLSKIMKEPPSKLSLT